MVTLKNLLSQKIKPRCMMVTLNLESYSTFAEMCMMVTLIIEHFGKEYQDSYGNTNHNKPH